MIVDLFAGPGGWDVAAQRLGLNPVGVEWDGAACETARAAGFGHVQADVAELDPATFLQQVAGAEPLVGLIASPPCQAFSLAGRGRGRAGAPVLLEGVARIASGEDPRLVCKEVDAALDDPRAALVLEPLRWALELEPTWIALEQVPPVLPLWQAIGAALAADGYWVDVGVLSAEQYDVPQTRRRAILLAHRERGVQLPAPARRKYRKGVAQDVEHRLDPPGLAPWISMEEALGWSGELVGFARRDDGREAVEIDGQLYRARDLRSSDLPAQVVTEKARSWMRSSAMERATVRAVGTPAPTITAGHDRNERVWMPVHERVSVQEAAVLQGFPADYPWRGSRTAQYRQIGDAIPPPLALHVLRAVTGLEVAA